MSISASLNSVDYLNDSGESKMLTADCRGICVLPMYPDAFVTYLPDRSERLSSHRCNEIAGASLGKAGGIHWEAIDEDISVKVS